jgi:ubiquinone/menaquinone biosynthesis C-methylase UbiE
MPLLDKLRQYLQPTRRKESEPAAAYDTWSQSYDNQPDNLMLALDQTLCSTLLEQIPLNGKTIVDVGCGTGRHWATLFARSPSRLVGYDVSAGMLEVLKKKYSRAETYLLSGPTLTGLEDASCDLVLSTLTIAHIPDLPAAMTEWCRVLKPGGKMLITDYHPAALAKGGQRTFREGDNLIAVRNHVYPIQQLLAITGSLGLQEVSVTEKKIDDSMRPYYEKQNAMSVFRRFLGVPIIYGIHLKKPDAAK